MTEFDFFDTNIILYTEDLQNGQWIDEVLEIRNPFSRA